MRVTCDKCGAPFAVDESRIPATGARTSCPKCRAMQIVRRPSAVPPLPGSPPSLSDLPDEPPTRPGVNPPSLAAPEDPPTTPRGAAPPPMAPRNEPPTAVMSTAALFQKAGLAAPPSAAPPGGDLFGAAIDFDAGPSETVPTETAHPAFGAPERAAPAFPQSPPLVGRAPPQVRARTGLKCRTCQTLLTDPFDLALGMCERCRTRSAGGPGGVGAVAETVPTNQYDVKPSEILAAAQDPVGAPVTQELPPMARALMLDSQPPPPTEPAAPAAHVGPLPVERKVETAMRPHKPARWGRRLMALLLLAVAGGGAYVSLERPDLIPAQLRPQAAAQKDAPAEQPKRKPALPSVEKRVAIWEGAGIKAAGTSDHNAKRGRELFLKDDTASYRGAEEAYRAAIMMDPHNLDAAAGYVESFAAGRARLAKPEEVEDARELIDAVIRARPGSSAALRAKANLMLAAGEVEIARAAAEDATKAATGEERAEALLVWGRTYLENSDVIAREKFDAALALDKSLKRAYFFRAQASESAGHHAQALADYRERLRLDPGHREALAGVVRVHGLVGDLPGALAAAEAFAAKHPQAREPQLWRAQLAYVLKGDLKEADKLLQPLRSAEGLEPDEQRWLHTLQAALARERGDLKKAREEGQAALAIDPAWAPAHFQLMLASIAAGFAEKAREHLKGCEKGLADPARIEEYRARIDAVAGQMEPALAGLRHSLELSPSRMSVRLYAASLLVKAGNENGAWSLMRKGLETDPRSLSRLKQPWSDFHERPGQLVQQAIKGFEDKKRKATIGSEIFAAIARYHLGDSKKPVKVFDRALRSDPTLLPALVYRAQIELDQRKLDKALTFARRAVAAERQSGVAHYLLGRVLEEKKKVADARAEYLKAATLEPALVPAHLRLGLLEAASKNKEEAARRLQQATSIEPEQLEARQALFALGS